MSVPYVFAYQTQPIPLAQLDVNFNTPITIGTTAVALGDAITVLNGLTLGLTTPAGSRFTYAYTSVVTATQSTSTIAVDCALSNVFETTLTSSIGTLTLSNPHDGQTINWFITQDATGSRTMAWGTSVKFPGGSGAGLLSTAANSVDLAILTYRSSTGFWYGSVVKAFSCLLPSVQHGW